MDQGEYNEVELGGTSNTTLRILSVKGGGEGTPLTDKIRKVVFEVPPNSCSETEKN